MFYSSSELTRHTRFSEFFIKMLKNRGFLTFLIFWKKIFKKKIGTSFEELQDDNKTFQIEWDILEHSRAYKKGDRFCHLCVSEKEWIAKLDPTTRINRSDEYVSKFPHRRKFKLGRIKNTKSIDLMKHTIIPVKDNAPDHNREINIIIPRRSDRTRRKTKTLDSNERVTWNKYFFSIRSMLLFNQRYILGTYKILIGKFVISYINHWRLVTWNAAYE